MRSFQIFPILINNLLSNSGLPVNAIAKKLRVKEKTVMNWKNGRFPPSLPQVFKLLDIFPEQRFEILWSTFHWTQLRGMRAGWHNFDLKKAIEDIIAGRNRKVTVSNKTLEYLVEAWREVDQIYLPETELIVPPQPSLVLLDKFALIIADVLRNSEHLYKMHWKEFEDLIAYLLKKFGWSISQMGYTKDDNVDLIAIKSVEPDIRFQMMVQCKKFSKHRKVGMNVVREVWSTKWEKGFHSAMIVTSSLFTKGAIQKADNLNLELKDHHSIINWCEKYGKIIRC